MANAMHALFLFRSTLIAIPLLAAGAAVADTSAKLPEVSGTPASNSSYWTDVQGGLLGGLAGTPEHCASDACNLYYGDTVAEDAAGAAVSGSPAVAASPPVESDDTPPAARSRRDVVADGERSSCEPSLQDPWRCYRR